MHTSDNVCWYTVANRNLHKLGFKMCPTLLIPELSPCMSISRGSKRRDLAPEPLALRKRLLQIRKAGMFVFNTGAKQKRPRRSSPDSLGNRDRLKPHRYT